MKGVVEDQARSVYSSEEAAELCGVHRNTIARWCTEGHIKAHMINGKWRIPHAEIVRLANTPSDAA